MQKTTNKLTIVPYIVARNFSGKLVALSDQAYAKHIGEVFTPDDLLTNASDDFAVTYELSKDCNKLYVSYLMDMYQHFAVLERKQEATK